jgi:hypothetical protein
VEWRRGLLFRLRVLKACMSIGLDWTREGGGVHGVKKMNSQKVLCLHMSVLHIIGHLANRTENIIKPKTASKARGAKKGKEKSTWYIIIDIDASFALGFIIFSVPTTHK